MEQALISGLSGDLSAASLMFLFIVGLLTRRFVPWWVYEDVLTKLEEYEEAAPELLEQVDTLIDMLQHTEGSTKPISARSQRELVMRQRRLEKVTRKRTSVRRKQRIRKS